MIANNYYYQGVILIMLLLQQIILTSYKVYARSTVPPQLHALLKCFWFTSLQCG